MYHTTGDSALGEGVQLIPWINVEPFVGQTAILTLRLSNSNSNAEGKIRIDDLVIARIESVEVDNDNDDIPDRFGNCPTTYNSSQEDSDNDGIVDACDNFPDVSILSGDINNDGNIDLTDAILIIKIMSNITSPFPLFKEADISEDGLIGLEEAIHALQVTSGVKP